MFVKPDFSVLFLWCLFLIAICIVGFVNGSKIYCHIYLFIFFWSILLCSYRLYKFETLSHSFEGKWVEVKGQIAGDIENQGNMTIYTVYTRTINSDQEKVCCDCKIRIIDYRNEKKYIIPYNSVIIEGEFKKGSRYNNTMSVDYDKVLFKDGICGTVIAGYDSDIYSTKCDDRYIAQLVYGFKKKIEGILSLCTDDRSVQILKGLLFGDTSTIQEDDYKNFQKSGIIHIFAVSGYNIWLFLYMLNILLFFLHNKRLKTIIIIMLLGFYSIMSGSTPSVVRAFIMASIILWGRILKREPDHLTSLSLAGIMILILNPLAVMDIGFQLSFISTASIIILSPALRKVWMPVNGRLRDIIVLTLSVQIGMLPVVVYYFNNFPIFSLISNIIIVPLVSLMIILGIMVILLNFIYTGAAFFTGYIIVWITRTILYMTEFIASIPYSNMNMISPGILGIVLYYAIMWVIFNWVKINKSWKSKILMGTAAILIFCMVSEMVPGELKISFIDVGQGDCILISTPDRKHILIDGGGKPDNPYSGFDIGKDVLKPYLYRHGINKIDLIVCTHFHDDHLNGLIPVMDSFRFGKLAVRGVEKSGSYDKLLSKVSMESKMVFKAVDGETIEVGRYVKLYVLNPEGHEYDENDSSVVIKMVYKDFSALFTGDISAEVEKRLATRHMRADVLKIPHHGSAASLTSDFLDSVNPEAAVICVGENKFGHPADVIVKKIKDKGISLYRTDQNGEIIITTRGQGFKVRTVM